MKLIRLAVAALLTLAVSVPALAQHENAFENANPNASFNRCGTRPLSQTEVRMIEDYVDSMRTRLKNAKKPDNPGNGNGGAGGGGGGGGRRPGGGGDRKGNGDRKGDRKGNDKKITILIAYT